MTRESAIKLLLAIAREDIGKREVTSNRAPWIAKLWRDTVYKDGMQDRAPYCAAGMCYAVAEWGRRLAAMGELRATLAMGLPEFERWRCKSARAFDWREWGRKRGLQGLPDTGTPQPGDIVVFDFSHIGLVTGVPNQAEIVTVEYNTNGGGSREGDGCMEKRRAKSLAQCFIRLL